MTNELVHAPAPAAVAEQPKRVSLVAKIAARYSVEPVKMMATLKATAFKSDKPISDEQMMALLIVADQYRLNPFTKELFAFPDKGGIVPVVSVDGWARIINEHPMLDGIDFEYEGPEDMPRAITCVIWRKDRQRPTRVTEYLVECKRGTAPWNSHPRRMLRHKALIQCARLAFGFAGLYDEDEAQRILNAADTVERVEPASASATRVRKALGQVTTVEPNAPAAEEAEPPAPPAEAEPAKSLEEWRHDVMKATDAETAGLVLDQARDVLTAEEHAALVAVYRGRWTQSKE